VCNSVRVVPEEHRSGHPLTSRFRAVRAARANTRARARARNPSDVFHRM